MSLKDWLKSKKLQFFEKDLNSHDVFTLQNLFEKRLPHFEVRHLNLWILQDKEESAIIKLMEERKKLYSNKSELYNWGN